MSNLQATLLKKGKYTYFTLIYKVWMNRPKKICCRTQAFSEKVDVKKIEEKCEKVQELWTTTVLLEQWKDLLKGCECIVEKWNVKERFTVTAYTYQV